MKRPMLILFMGMVFLSILIIHLLLYVIGLVEPIQNLRYEGDGYRYIPRYTFAVNVLVNGDSMMKVLRLRQILIF